MINMEEIVKNADGSIRYCDKNIYLLGYPFVLKHTYTLKNLSDLFQQCISGIWTGIQSLLFLIVLPIVPFIQSWYRLKQTRELVDYEKGN